jgi:cyanophycinase
MRAHGRIALVGSGEYLPVMQEFEAMLLDAGGSKRYVQVPTAAGRESASRLDYWREIGADQAERIGAEQIFLPIFNREDALREDLAAQIDGAGLIYLSGGDPHYLASTLTGTPIWAAIERNWRAGSSLAGCSAGAMAMGPDIPNFRKMKEPGTEGLGLIPHIRTIPHYNKFFKWIPDAAAQLFLKAPTHITVAGIDENTAIWSDDLSNWNVVGKGSLHLLTGERLGKFAHGSLVTF